MKRHYSINWLCGVFLANALLITQAHGGDTPGIVGKNEWLFVRSEVAGPADMAPTAQSIDLIARFNKVLVANGITMAVTIVPMKMRLYADNLPDNIKFNSYMASNYERMSKLLRDAGVTFIDLNTPFMSNSKLHPDAPLFFKLDGHWNYTGAELAAQTFKGAIEADATLKKAFDATPQVAYKMTVGKRLLPSKARELIALIPPSSVTYEPELYRPFNVARAQPLSAKDASETGISMQGSSASQEWTGFLDMLRYALQRDVLNASVPADKGAWFGMETFVRSDAFQNKAPKLLLWERSEYTMRAPPDYQYQNARFKSDNTEWLLRASAWVQATCRQSNVIPKVMPVGLAANASNVKGQNIQTGPTNDTDFIEINFDKPIEKLDYLSARTSAMGSKSLVLEGSAPGGGSRRFTMETVGDGTLRNLKTPLPSNSNGFTKVRIYPGKSDGFVFTELMVCRQFEDLLK